MQSPEDIQHIITLVRVARILVGQAEADAVMAEHQRVTIADLILSGWHPIAAAEFVRLNCPQGF